MIRVDGAGRGIWFAAAAALGWLPCALVCGPWWLGRATLAWYLAAAAAVYLSALAATPARRVQTSLVAGAMAMGVAAAGAPPTATILALAVLVAVGRGGFVMGGGRGRRTARLGRAVAVEAALGAGGLAAAALAARGPDPGPLAVALAIWSYFAVQSLHFWIGGGTPAAAPGAVDPFVAAKERVERILGRAQI